MFPIPTAEWRRRLSSSWGRQNSATPWCPLSRAPPQAPVVMMKNINAITGRHKDPFSLRSAHVSLCTRRQLPLQQKVPAREKKKKKKRAQIKNHVLRVSTLSFIATWTHWASDWGVMMFQRCARAWLSLLRLSQGKLSAKTKPKKKKPALLLLLRLAETKPHSSSAAF